MASFNKVILLGNVTRDPELRYISSGSAVTEVGLAINNRRKGPNGDLIEETTFVDVTFWSRDAEIIGEYVTKGTPLMVEGRLKLDTWEKDGKKNSKLRVVGERMQLLGSRGDGPRGDASRSKARAAGGRPAPQVDEYDQSGGYDAAVSGGIESSGPVGSDDDIPF